MLVRPVKLLLWMMLITGIVYPALITLIAHLTMPHRAGGSLVAVKGKVIGSHLIGQKFESNQYFWGRPSAADYNALSSGGSNLGPISAELKNLVAERKAKLRQASRAFDEGADGIE